MANVAVIGLGHIGLPLAALYACKGHRVFGCDINPEVVQMVRAGLAYDDEPDLRPLVAAAVRAGRLTAHTNTAEAVAQAEVVVIIVPLIIDREKRIDYRAINAATADVAVGLKPGTLVIYETTLPVGDTRHHFGPLLEQHSGLVMGKDFSLAFSPERVYVGRVFKDLEKYPKVVGGIDTLSTQKAVEFYRSVLEAEVLPVDSTEAAEFCKLAETTYRDVNIALANEFALYAEEVGVDIEQVIRAANSQPFSHIHRPGIGVGGHCIPVYPYFYASRTDHARLAQLAREINDRMAEHAATRLDGALGGLAGRTVLVLGLAYRENVKEDAFTVTNRLVAALRDRGGRVLVHDPLYTEEEIRGRGFEPFDFEHPEQVDAVVLQAAHASYQEVNWSTLPGLRVVLDGRNALEPAKVPTDVRYLGIGRRLVAAHDRGPRV